MGSSGRQVGGGFPPTPALRQTPRRRPRPFSRARSMATSSVSGSSSSASSSPRVCLTPTANADSTTWRAGHGTPTPTGGRRVSADSRATSKATVMPASRGPAPSMATRSVRGSPCNASTTPKAPLTPTANADLRSCPAGHGTPRPTSGRKVSADSWTTSNATVTPSSRGRTRSMATGSVMGQHTTQLPHQRHPGRRPPTPTPERDRLDMGPLADRWEEGFSRLLHYVERHDHARVPSPTRSMATGSVPGSTANAPTTLKASLTPIVNTGSKTSPARHGTRTPTSGRRVSADCCTTSNATVMPASRSPARSMTIGSVVGHNSTPKPQKRHPGRRTPTPTSGPARLDMEGIVVDLASGLSHGAYVKCHPRMIAASCCPHPLQHSRCHAPMVFAPETGHRRGWCGLPCTASTLVWMGRRIGASQCESEVRGQRRRLPRQAWPLTRSLQIIAEFAMGPVEGHHASMHPTPPPTGWPGGHPSWMAPTGHDSDLPRLRDMGPIRCLPTRCRASAATPDPPSMPPAVTRIRRRDSPVAVIRRCSARTILLIEWNTRSLLRGPDHPTSM